MAPVAHGTVARSTIRQVNVSVGVNAEESAAVVDGGSRDDGGALPASSAPVLSPSPRPIAPVRMRASQNEMTSASMPTGGAFLGQPRARRTTGKKVRGRRGTGP